MGGCTQADGVWCSAGLSLHVSPCTVNAMQALATLSGLPGRPCLSMAMLTLPLLSSAQLTLLSSALAVWSWTYGVADSVAVPSASLRVGFWESLTVLASVEHSSGVRYIPRANAAFFTTRVDTHPTFLVARCKYTIFRRAPWPMMLQFRSVL